MNRREVLKAFAALACSSVIAPNARAANESHTLIGAAWRGPASSDPYFAGVLAADWAARKLSIRYAVPLPTRPHGLLAQADGGLLIAGARPGAWLVRCDGEGAVMRTHRIEDEGSCRLGGHAIVAANSEHIYTTETDQRNGRGRIGVRDRATLSKLAEWDSHGLDPHQLLLDADGHLIIANGGVPRTPADKKYDLQRMDASLVRLSHADGRLLGQWRQDDPRLSLRHMAWSTAADGTRRLGIAMQAEHDSVAQRSAAPVLAVFDGITLTTPAKSDDGRGYAGDIAAAGDGGFVLSSNQAGVAQLWRPARPQLITPVVKLEEAYALASWPANEKPGGVLIATALGLGRWHPVAPPLLLRWPQPMALDNHWVAMG